MNHRSRPLLFSSAVLCVLAASPQCLRATDFHVYYLGGQSNMDGYGFVKELPHELQRGVPDVWIFHGNVGRDGTPPDGRGLWAELKPGHGRYFSSDGETNKYTDRFGAELTFARRLKELYPDRHIALIKYSKGGTSISADAPAAKRFGCWEKDWSGGTGDGQGINQFDHFLATLKQARADKDIDNDGKPDRLIPSGIIWMQGESDADPLEVAEQYEKNLTTLMGQLREELGDKSQRVVIGRITNWDVWKHGDVVRDAQAAFVKNDTNARLVTSTDDYGKSDAWHYDSAGYLDLGQRFADAVADSP